jgi:hypothetical protein
VIWDSSNKKIKVKGKNDGRRVWSGWHDEKAKLKRKSELKEEKDLNQIEWYYDSDLSSFVWIKIINNVMWDHALAFFTFYFLGLIFL